MGVPEAHGPVEIRKCFEGWELILQSVLFDKNSETMRQTVSYRLVISLLPDAEV